MGTNNFLAPNLKRAIMFASFYKASNKEIIVDKMGDIIEEYANLFSNRIMMSFFNINKTLNIWRKIMPIYQNWYNKNSSINSWEVGFDDNLHKDGSYYYFKTCPIYDFFKEENLMGLMPKICKIDYISFSHQHARLIRKGTLAKGNDICDFWIVGDKIKDPK